MGAYGDEGGRKSMWSLCIKSLPKDSPWEEARRTRIGLGGEGGEDNPGGYIQGLTAIRKQEGKSSVEPFLSLAWKTSGADEWKW